MRKKRHAKLSVSEVSQVERDEEEMSRVSWLASDLTTGVVGEGGCDKAALGPVDCRSGNNSVCVCVRAL